jgi:membrane-associated phospholipid phosphatase
MRFGSLFGFELILVSIPLLFWSGKKSLQQLATSMTHVTLVGLFLVGFIKALFKEPRPFQLYKSIQGDYSGSKEFSFPSAHTFCSVIVLFTFGDYLIEKYPKRKLSIRVFISLFSVFVGLSRIYFGVHFPHDVICGFCGGLFTYILHSELFGNIKKGQKKLKLMMIGVMFLMDLIFLDAEQIVSILCFSNFRVLKLDYISLLQVYLPTLLFEF